MDIPYSQKFRSFRNQNIGTGQNPKQADEFGFTQAGGAAMPAPTITKHMVVNAGKPESSGRPKK